MEIKFRDFVCLTQGDTITVKTDLKHNPEFKFDIVELKPNSQFKTVSIINCDLNLDFEAPLDYEEPAEPTMAKRNSSVVMENGRRGLSRQGEQRVFGVHRQAHAFRWKDSKR